MERTSERGFTLVELLLGIAVGSIVLGVVVTLAASLSRSAASVNRSTAGSASVDALVQAIDTETASAWAVFVPAQDLAGNANGDGHEIDFYTEDGAHRPYVWAYSFSTKTNTVTRYTYGNGNAPVATQTFTPITAFAATIVPATQIASIDPLFAATSVSDVSYPMPALPSATGGNGAVQLHIGANGADRSELLASTTAPTSFTVLVGYTPSPSPVVTPTLTPLPVGTP